MENQKPVLLVFVSQCWDLNDYAIEVGRDAFDARPVLDTITLDCLPESVDGLDNIEKELKDKAFMLGLIPYHDGPFYFDAGLANGYKDYLSERKGAAVQPSIPPEIAWRTLEPGCCPCCGEDGTFTFQESHLDNFLAHHGGREDATAVGAEVDEDLGVDVGFSLQLGGSYTEWYRCASCGGEWYVSREFRPVGKVQFSVERNA